MLLLHLKADKELNILFVLHIFLQIIAVLALLEFHIALAALDDRTCLTCGKWSLQVLGLQGKYSLQGQQVRSSLHSPAQGPRDFPDALPMLIMKDITKNIIFFEFSSSSCLSPMYFCLVPRGYNGIFTFHCS